MFLNKDILAQLILINEALRAGNSIQTHQLSEIRASSEYNRKSMEVLQKSYAEQVAEAVQRRSRHHYVSERREAGLPLQARTPKPPPKVETQRTHVSEQPFTSGRFAEVPLSRYDDVDYYTK